MGRNFITRSKLPNLRLEVKPIGNWQKTIRTFQQLGPAVKRASIKAQLKVCNEIAKKVKAHLRNQDLGWKKLSPEYAQRKQELGLDHRILMAYGNYYHSIEVWQVGNRHMTFVGVKKGKYTQTLSGKRSSLDIATIATLHEFSRGKHFPRRPLWNPTITEIGGAAGIKKMYVNSLRYWLRKEGLPVEATIKKLGWH